LAALLFEQEVAIHLEQRTKVDEQKDATTDIAGRAPGTIPGILLTRPSVSLIAINWLFCIIAAYCNALALAYLAPFGGRSQNQHSAPDPELEGRDPRW
jgi:hypothetical protein